MKLVTQTPKKALKAFLKQKPLRSEIDVFKTNLIALLDKISVIEKRPKDETEEHLKNDLRDFLRDTYYRDTNAINTKDKKDLVIHLDKTTNSEVGVIIEAKRPTNIGEMVTADNPNKKALHELILYYLDERNKVGNFQLKQLVITNINEWYIIDANHFDKHIYNNTQIQNLYKTKVSDNKNNPFFYQEIEKLISKIDIEIPCVYFDIREYDTILRNNKKEDDRELSALLKILSPQHLLKIVTPNDSNSLNDKFYKELLHIIGLEEAKEDGKNIIRRKKESRFAASLIEATIEALQTEDVLHRLPDQSIYGSTKDERIFNIALELGITWINRILFLKLLEGQLITYHQGNKEYRFLNTETINDFDELFKLFHKVLAVNLSERSEAIKTKYGKVPYLNSSLFEISELEDQTIKINSLDNGGKLELIGTTILKEIKKKAATLPTLDYLFHFLDAYDFASEGTEDVQEDNKTIINASVLGKVFEKINGYKDGSIFTPAFITMYMCKQSIRLAVVEKFNEALSQKDKTLFDKFEDVKNYTSRLFKTQEILKANEIINSLRICDPAVGSGHFLVSSLNEIISIKAELGILADKEGNSISGYEIEIVNDELIITDPKTNILEYKLQNGKPLNKEIQRLQKALFYEKQNIIENCLFGVDINPNSVKICRLRLWIELLKNAYYKEETNFLELETLPNIDINIKCGNSLLSRFPLDADLSKALKSIKYDVKAYRGFVNDYKNEKSRDVKRGLQKIIDTIKTDFRTEIGNNDPKQIKLKKLSGDLFTLLNQGQIFELTPKEKKARKEKQTKLEADITKLSNEIEEIKSNAIYKNAFEWRFEFPEVLSNDGEFEGFDIIIANPPYIQHRELAHLSSNLKEHYNVYSGTADISSYFFEKALTVLKPKGILSVINSNKFFNAEYGKPLRAFLSNYNFKEIVNFEQVPIFDEALVSSAIFIIP
ncbi:type IIG restriction enzyme/methyltransferase [Williamwhitmania taraxaci]|uniref:site-specific DNA-methyltransferase (adenine-specific) n=1 Tax=Williamwhitmania taraxaci TaxID=1640674 RepID=A0A1G6TU72_9BACT|nr:Eco57I restriction-modification methylase domain-containing protein [Williamwhitmania taraxaci]SDD32474.1 Eco57I restriction-modification methylase [Williamwhitmania taraxaci]